MGLKGIAVPIEVADLKSQPAKRSMGEMPPFVDRRRFDVRTAAANVPVRIPLRSCTFLLGRAVEEFVETVDIPVHRAIGGVIGAIDGNMVDI